MILNTRQQRDYRQNLLDAGCEEDTAKRCIELMREDKIAETLKLLTAFRGQLLDSMHVSQTRIDCLDYFIRIIRKENFREE